MPKPIKPEDMTIDEMKKEIHRWRRLEARRTKKLPDDVESTFNVFYKLYTRHVGRKGAMKVWLRLHKEGEFGNGLFETILTAVKLQSKFGGRLSPTADGLKKYIPHPSVWLNGAEWENEIEEAVEPEAASKTISQARAKELL